LSELFAIVYPDESSAGRAAEEVERCAEELAIDPDAASTVICEHDGNCRLTTSRRAGATTDWSRFWGILPGLILDGGERPEIDPQFRTGLRRLIRPGTSVLLIAVPAAVRAQVLEALRQFGGTVLRCDLEGDASERSNLADLRFDR
jgi:uncharacterized membrane protein